MPVDPRRVKALFNAALDLPELADRHAFLERECHGDRQLRQRLDALLAAHDRPASELERPVAANQEGTPVGTEPDPATAGSEPPASDVEQTASNQRESPAPASLIGSIIAGRYKLREEIGEGGMGSVYLAEQTQPVKRQVALKLIKPGMDSKAVLARFESERQALALMDHPNIAKVFDAGTTEGGRPYFVMELVKGVPLTDYCDQHRVGLPERLALFRQICSAVQHAHQKGIIHRDLKPTNILVEGHDGEAVPKVIDFGLAKATSGMKLSDRSLYTAFGTVAGTPLYMAPEQAVFNALDIDTRADIYALGVILYELLTGSTPIRRETFRQAALEEMLRLIREVEPPTPSSRINTSDALPSVAATRHIEPAKLSRFVRGDLDWIVMKALAKERSRRYESAIALAQDIERFTNHEPVSAGPPTAAYRIRKFARRHRVALATTGAFALLLVAATAASAGLAAWANRERIRAVKAEQSAKEQQGRAQDREKMAIDAVKRYGDVVRETPELKNNPGLAKLRATLLKEPQAFFKRLRDRLQADRETTTDSLSRLAAASFDLGMLTDEIGDKQDALRAHEESLEIWERLARENPTVSAYQRALAKSHASVGALQSHTGRPAEALKSHEEARAIQERLVRKNSSITEFQSDLALSHNNIGIVQNATGRPAQALDSFEQARAIFERLARENPSVADFQRNLASIHNNVGNMQSTMGRPADSLESYQQARAIFERLGREDPSITQFQSDLAASYNSIGVLQSETGRPSDALASYEKSRAIRERLAHEHPSITQFQDDLAAIYHNIGNLQTTTGRPMEALKSNEQGRAIYERLARENPSVTAFQRSLAGIDLNIGKLQSDTGRTAEAMASYEQARAILERLTRENPSVTAFQSSLATIHNNVGGVHADTGRTVEAMASYEQARAIRERLARENPSVTQFQIDLVNSHYNIGVLQSKSGRLAEALASSEQANTMIKPLASANPSVTEFQRYLAATYTNIGWIQSATGRTAEGLESYEKARAIWERLARENPSSTEFPNGLSVMLNNIGDLQRAAGRPAEALASHEHVLAIRERLARENPSVIEFQSRLAMSHNNIGELQSTTGRLAEALASHEQAREIRERVARENRSVTQIQSELADSHNSIGSLQLTMGRPAEARASYEKSRAIRERLAREHPESPEFASAIGGTLSNMAVIDLGERQFDKAKAKLTQAIEWERKALTVRPNDTTYRKFLANQLKNLIRADEGLGRADDADQARRALAKLAATDPAQAALDARLAAVLKGQTPKDNSERIQLADRAYQKALHASAARLYAEAIAKNPKLADDRRTQQAYNAACAAALAGSGAGKDDPAPDEAARAKLRRQARDWLEAELAAWAKVLDSGPVERKATIAPTLKHWKTDTDLAGIRDDKELAKLPEAERAALKQFWSEVDRLLTKAAGISSSTQK